MNLQAKLMLLIGTTVAVVTLVGVFAFDALVADEAEQELWRRARAIASTAAQSVRLTLAETIREQEERHEVAVGLEARPYIDHVVIFDDDLRPDPAARTQRTPAAPAAWELEAAEEVKATGRTVVRSEPPAAFFPVFLEEAEFAAVVEVAFATDHPRPQGTVALLADFVPDAVASSLAASEVVGGGLESLTRELAGIDDVLWVEVFDAEATVVAHTDISRVGKPPLPEHTAVVKKLLQDGEPVRENDLERHRLNLFVPVVDTTGSRIGAVEVVMDRRAIDAERADIRRIFVIGGLLILFALAGAIALLTQRLIVARIRKILDGMSRFARGETKFEISTDGEDELSVLTQSFNQLLRTVDHTTVSRAQAEAIFNAVPDALFVTTHDGVILEANHAAERQTGLSIDRLVGKRVSTLLTPHTEEHDDEQADASLRRGELVSKEGAVDVLVSRTAIGGTRDEGRQVWSAQLLTAREQADEALAKARLALERRQRLESLGRLAGGVAHDFNNLLTVILTAATILDEMDSEEQKFDEEINAITEAARRGAKLTEQLLVLGRRRPRREKSCAVDDVVGRVVPLLERLLDRRVSFSTALHADKAVALISPDELEQVVLNLVLNARDACGDGGEIKVSTSLSGDGGREEVVVAVSDNGEGMDEATASQIFDPFFTTKAAGKGTGLGLSTVHGIVTRSDGDIEVDSAVGRGTTFTIRLPRSAADEAKAAPSQTASTIANSGGGSTVLLVEDEDTVRRATIRALKSFGFEVVAAENGERALEIASEVKFDVVLSDVIMPGMKGTELANHIYQKHPGVPVVFMSGYTGDLLDDEVLAKAAGFVSKPFRPQDLAHTVERAINERASA